MNRFSTGNIATLMDTPTSQGISVHERVSCAARATPLQCRTCHWRALADGPRSQGCSPHCCL